MTLSRTAAYAALLLAVIGATHAAHPLFNGKNLQGWVNVNTDPDTWQVRDGMIYTTGTPTGFLRTEKMYENFILDFDWKHEPRQDGQEGNSGLFVWADPLPAPSQGEFARAVEVQVLVGLEWRDEKTGALTATSHGDLFSIWGQSCKPDRPHPLGWERSIPREARAKGFGEWNHYRLIARDGAVTLEVNGKAVSGMSQCRQRKGYLALEAEGNPIYFRNLSLQELPGSHPAADQIAIEGSGWQRLYNGRNLAGWKVEPGSEGHWRADGWHITYDGKSAAQEPNLWSDKAYGDFELVVDWRFSGPTYKETIQVVLPNGDEEKDAEGKEKQVEIDSFGDSGIYLRGSSKSQVNIWSWPIGSGEVYGYRTDLGMSPQVRAGVTPRVHADNKPGEWNRFHITMKGDRLTVVLNGKTVLENAQLPGVAPRGPIALQHHDSPIEFANIYLREL